MTAEEFAERRARVAELTREGKSQRQIATELSISRDQVVRDQRALKRTTVRTTDTAGAAPAAPVRTTEETGAHHGDAPGAPGAHQEAAPPEAVRTTVGSGADGGAHQVRTAPADSSHTGAAGGTPVVAVAVDEQLAAAFAALSPTGCTPEEAVAFAVERLATAYVAARRTGRLPAGPIEVIRMTLQSAAEPYTPVAEAPSLPAVDTRVGAAL